MTLTVTLLASLSAAVYLAAACASLAKRWRPCAGHPALNLLAVAAFAIQRLVPNSTFAAAVSAVLTIAAIAAIVRRSSPFAAGMFALPPAATMLLVVLRPFFSPALALLLQHATVALLCVAAPLGVILFSLGRSTFRTTSDR